MWFGYWSWEGMALRNNKRNDCNDVQSLLTQGNQLLEGAYDITLIEMRLLYLALTKI
ncbi:replication initiation protein, partial [Escherichia coli]